MALFFLFLGFLSCPEGHATFLERERPEESPGEEESSLEQDKEPHIPFWQKPPPPESPPGMPSRDLHSKLESLEHLFSVSDSTLFELSLYYSDFISLL